MAIRKINPDLTPNPMASNPDSWLEDRVFEVKEAGMKGSGNTDDAAHGSMRKRKKNKKKKRPY